MLSKINAVMIKYFQLKDGQINFVFNVKPKEPVKITNIIIA